MWQSIAKNWFIPWYAVVWLHKHNDVTIAYLSVDLIVFCKWKLFASLLKLVKSEINMKLTSNPNSIH